MYYIYPMITGELAISPVRILANGEPTTCIPVTSPAQLANVLMQHYPNRYPDKEADYVTAYNRACEILDQMDNQ